MTNSLNVTVCELSDDRTVFEKDWKNLVSHCRQHKSDLIVLPEMIFSSWFFESPTVDYVKWNEMVEQQQKCLTLLAELAPAAVVGSVAKMRRRERVNESFLWNQEYQALRSKYFFPEEEGYYERTWFQAGDKEFALASHGSVKFGVALCTELWAMPQIQEYGRNGAHMIICPRATMAATGDKWLVAGKASAIISGAYSISSNRAGAGKSGLFGGQGWIIDPDGEVLALTSGEEPFITRTISIERTERAKHTYPREVFFQPDVSK